MDFLLRQERPFRRRFCAFVVGVKFRGNLNASGTRDIIKNLSHWYVPENPMFKISGEGETRTSELYDEYIASILKNISDGNGEISLRELSALNEVMGYFVHFVENYNKIKRNVFEIQKIKAQVKTFRFNLRFYWCGRRELNPYGKTTRPSNVRVCQFRHSRNNANYYTPKNKHCQGVF